MFIVYIIINVLHIVYVKMYANILNIHLLYPIINIIEKNASSLYSRECHMVIGITQFVSLLTVLNVPTYL